MKCKSNHAGYEKQKYRQQLQVGAENGSAARFLLVLSRKHTLYDELVGTPIPKPDNGRPHQRSQPRKLRILVAAHQVGHHIAVFVHRSGTADAHHLVPAAQLFQSQHQNHHRPQQQNRRLGHRSVQHRTHPSEDGIECRQHHQSYRGNPEEIDSPQLLDTEDLLEYQPTGIHCHRYFGQHVTDQRNHRKNRPRLRIVALLQKLRHGIHHTPAVKRHKHPSQQQNEPSLNFPVGHRHTARSARSGQADQVLRTDVRRKYRCPDGNPCRIATSQKVIGSIFLPLLHYPHDYPDQDSHE